MLSFPVQVAPPTQSATDFVFETLYKAIVKLLLPPGSRVSEAEVAERFQVSRQPVRDAFFRLANRGFVVIRPQRATLITKISEAEVLRSAFIRVALETACMKEAVARVTQGDMADLRRIVDAQGEAVTRRDSSAFHDLDEAFHARLCEVAGHQKVWDLIREQKGHMDRARFLSLSFNQATAHQEHITILDALEARDTGLTIGLLDSHLTKIRTHLARIRREHGQFFEDEA